MPYFLGISKETVQPWYTREDSSGIAPEEAAVKQQSGTIAPMLHALVFVTATVLLYFCVCDVHLEMQS